MILCVLFGSLLSKSVAAEVVIVCCGTACRMETGGVWSQEGVTTEVTFHDKDKGTYDVICTSTHLTSFAVMLDVNMALSVSCCCFRCHILLTMLLLLFIHRKLRTKP